MDLRKLVLRLSYQIAQSFIKKGVHVVTVLPGFVVTKMTEGMNLHTFLTSKKKKMAQVIFNGVQKTKYNLF